MEDPVIQTRVPDPTGCYLGVRATINGRGYWAGQALHDYDEPRCKADALRGLKRG